MPFRIVCCQFEGLRTKEFSDISYRFLLSPHVGFRIDHPTQTCRALIFVASQVIAEVDAQLDQYQHKADQSFLLLTDNQYISVPCLFRTWTSVAPSSRPVTSNEWSLVD